MMVGMKIAGIILGVIIVLVFTLKLGKRALGIGRYDSREYCLPESAFQSWEEVLSNPRNIRMETLHTGDVTGNVHGIINIKGRKDLGIKNESLKAPLLSHLISHEKFGEFLIDTGFDSSYSEKPWGHFEGLLKSTFKYGVEKGSGIDEILAKRKIRLKGVFCTHFHEHQGGAPALPIDIPFIFGKGEKDIDFFPIVYSRFLKDKADTRTIDFDKAVGLPVLGKCADLFGDGSLWAISTPGHTKGHVSYLINGVEGQYLVMGDICMCERGYDLEIESGGTYADNLQMNRDSFLKVKRFLDSYPNVKPVFGHESEKFRISYK